MRVAMLSRARVFSLMILSFPLIRCGTSSDATSADSTPPDAGLIDGEATANGATWPPASLVRLGANDRCLPRALPTSSDGGGPACRVVLSGVNGDCSQSGLSPAAPGDAATIASALNAQGSTEPAGTLCLLHELDGTNCTAEATSGWCYVRGSCSADAGPACEQAICASTGFLGERLGYSLAWILCP